MSENKDTKENRLKELFAKQAQSEKEAKEAADDSMQVIGFFVGNEEFAVPILNVREIVKPIEYTRVPGTPNYVLGVFSLRGNVLPLINLRLKFGLSDTKQDNDTRYLVLNNKDEIAGFVIDKLTEAVKIPQSDIEPIPKSFGEDDTMMLGIGKKEDRLITILQVESLLKRSF